MMAASDAVNKQQMPAAEEKTERKFQEVADMFSGMATQAAQQQEKAAEQQARAAEQQARAAEEAAEQKRKAAEDTAMLRAAQITGAKAQGDLAKLFNSLMGQVSQPALQQADVNEEVVAADDEYVDFGEEAAIAKARAE